MGQALREAASFIDGAISGGGCVVVHCAAGISRSATVVLGYFLLHRGTTLREAFEHLYNCRPCMWPNEGFMASLINLEQEVQGISTISSEEYAHWGEWEGPEETGAQSRSFAMPMGLPRLNRDDTCLEDEVRSMTVMFEAGLYPYPHPHLRCERWPSLRPCCTVNTSSQSRFRFLP
uniref:protein-tyrosine-phosphatase n=1 Tax=Haptolina brevifila TaxID=156173 RepID=A0A7S2B8P5_9EUKA